MKQIYPLRIAIVQPRMEWTGVDNTASIIQFIEQAAKRGAELCVFPELAVTGFHRRIAEMAQRGAVASCIDAIKEICAEHSIAASFGTPTFDDAGRIYNSQVFVDEMGRLVSAVEKSGLTEPEANFFARGRARPVMHFRGHRCTAVICREVEDLDEVCSDLLQGELPSLIFWPGLMGLPNDDPVDVIPPHVQRAQAVARRVGAFVVQSNWPNSLNCPEMSAKTGGSVVIAPTGEICLMLPHAEAGSGCFTLGESSYSWVASTNSERVAAWN